MGASQLEIGYKVVSLNMLISNAAATIEIGSKFVENGAMFLLLSKKKWHTSLKFIGYLS